jgi:hypothetical protein
LGSTESRRGGVAFDEKKENSETVGDVDVDLRGREKHPIPLLIEIIPLLIEKKILTKLRLLNAI